MQHFNINDFCLPLPLQIVIDDVGWWSGKDDSANNGPFRSGINRNHVPADYTALAELGKQLNPKPLSSYIELKNSDGGIMPGKLIFTDDLERFANEKIDDILSTITV